MKKENQKVYIVSELESTDRYTCHRVIFTSTDINHAKERNHQEIRSFIEGWHEGDEEEKYTMEQYYENGVKPHMTKVTCFLLPQRTALCVNGSA